jgi:hypothetical protein
MDSKTKGADVTAPRMSRWLAYARSKASGMLKSTQRSPFEEGLRLTLVARNPERRGAPLPQSGEHLTKA